jgi:hypothetical protein
MFIILLATIMSGVICSKILMLLGVSRMPVRYGIAIIVSYLLFFLFVKLWLLYIGVEKHVRSTKNKGKSGSDWSDLIPSLRGSGSSGTPRLFSGFGGGRSGGGGAGGVVTDSPSNMAVPVGVGSDPSVPHGGGGGNILEGVSNIGDEGFLKFVAIVLLVALVLSIVLVGGYLILSAPHILADAAFQVLLVTGLSHKVRQAKRTGWEISILGATWWCFLLILFFSVAFGIAAQHYNPAAVSVRDLFTSAN